MVREHVSSVQQIVIEDPDPPAQDCQTVEMDVSLDCSNLGSSSFLSVPGRMESIVDIGSAGSVSRAILCTS